MSKTLMDRVVDYMERNGSSFDRVQDDQLVSGFSGEEGDYGIYVEADDDSQVIGVYAIYPEDVPAPRRPAVAELLTRANFGLPVGNFELDFEDGQIRFKAAVPCEGFTPEDSLIESLFGCVADTIDRYAPAIVQVVAGAEPLPALLSVEGDDEDDDGDDDQDD